MNKREVLKFCLVKGASGAYSYGTPPTTNTSKMTGAQSPTNQPAKAMATPKITAPKPVNITTPTLDM